MRKMSNWGEIPTVPETDSGIMAIEREQITKPRPMDVEGPWLYQPSSRHSPPTNDSLPAERFQIDAITLHTIRLLQHARKLRHLIHTVQQQLQENLKTGDADITYPATPSIPEFEGPPPKHNFLKPVPFMPIPLENLSDFVKGKSEPPPVVDDMACRKLLRRSVATICAHAGFDNSSESVLEMLTDLTSEYYLQFTKHMRAAADHQALHGSSGFPDIMCQVFAEMGLGSITTLHDFYQTRILQYHENMIETCQQLSQEYNKLKHPLENKQETFTLIKIKEEAYTDIQFPNLDDTDEDPEQLLQLDALGSFEITVEQESASGLTTEVESKWMNQGIKSEPPDLKYAK
ncbi:STAGA complex 65 subunit gamma-like isoform X1 [Liolophura sinensis]|uniref:STAGA complex 65 subunit gamma-like isoform X1 n=1 Tax=Liolophura sinensis TaxID=3198878 RepID=UPI0031582F23